MKKLIKKQKAVTPARPKTGYMSYCAKVRAEVTTEFPGASTAEVSKKLSEKWQALPPEDKQVFQAEAKTEHDAWVLEMAAFKRTEQYRVCIDEHTALELKQGLKRLKEDYADKMPKRPPNAANLWAASSGTKVSVADVSSLFQALEEEQHKHWNELAEQNRAAYKKATEAFDSSKDGKRFHQQQAALKNKLHLAGARKKFLVDAPNKIPGVQIICRTSDQHPDRAGEWSKLSETNQKLWEAEHARLLAEYDKETVEFRKTDAWKQFERATTTSCWQTGGL